MLSFRMVAGTLVNFHFVYEVLVHMRKTHARHCRTLPVTKGALRYLIDSALQGGVVWVRNQQLRTRLLKL